MSSNEVNTIDLFAYMRARAVGTPVADAMKMAAVDGAKEATDQPAALKRPEPPTYDEAVSAFENAFGPITGTRDEQLAKLMAVQVMLESFEILTEANLEALWYDDDNLTNP